VWIENEGESRVFCSYTGRNFFQHILYKIPLCFFWVAAECPSGAMRQNGAQRDCPVSQQLRQSVDGRRFHFQVHDFVSLKFKCLQQIQIAWESHWGAQLSALRAVKTGVGCRDAKVKILDKMPQQTFVSLRKIWADREIPLARCVCPERRQQRVLLLTFRSVKLHQSVHANRPGRADK